jgi:hypothetical protein
VKSHRLSVLLMVMVLMVVIPRFYFDDCMHPGMDTTLEVMSPFAEVFDLYTLTRSDKRGNSLSAY